MYLSYNLHFELFHDVTSLSDSGLYSDSEDSTSEQEEVVDSDEDSKAEEEPLEDLAK